MTYPPDGFSPVREREPEPRLRVAFRVAIVSTVLAGAALVAARFPAERARHLAVPVFVDPSLPTAPAPAVQLARLECRSRELAQVGRRVTALLAAGDGSVWVGTFDDGVVRLGGGQATAATRALAGRRRMVNGLAADAGTIWAATQDGLVALDGPGAGRVLLGDESVSSLARAGCRLYAGGGHGLYLLAEGGAEVVPATGPDGEALRVNALAARPDQDGGTGRLWVGTATGAYSLELAELAAHRPAAAAWRPLVFGDPPAATNVVTALAVLGDAAVAGTDDGGLARIGPHGEVAAVRFADALANQVNPGAAAASGSTLAFGTQGGGLLLVRARGAGLEVRRPSGLDGVAVSAVAAGETGWLVGTADGRVLRVACPEVVGSD